MRQLQIIIIVIFFTYNTKAQCRLTNMYGFGLSVLHPEEITASVLYKGKILEPKSKLICGKPFKIKPQFTYIKNTTNVLNGIVLPYTLKKNCFYWLLDDEMAIELATSPAAFKIILTTNNKALKQQYEFPTTYDFLSQNTIYLDLLDKSKKNIEQEYTDKIWQLSLVKKEDKIVEKNNEEIDTTIIYTLSQQIPLGILKRFPKIDSLKNSNNFFFYCIWNII